MSDASSSSTGRIRFPRLFCRTAALALALVALSVLIGSQGILHAKRAGPRPYQTRRLKVPKDLQSARIAKAKDQVSHRRFCSSAEERHLLYAGSGGLTRTRGSVPPIAAAWIARPEYLRHFSDPNTHSGPPA